MNAPRKPTTVQEPGEARHVSDAVMAHLCKPTGRPLPDFIADPSTANLPKKPPTRRQP